MACSVVGPAAGVARVVAVLVAYWALQPLRRLRFGVCWVLRRSVNKSVLSCFAWVNTTGPLNPDCSGIREV